MKMSFPTEIHKKCYEAMCQGDNVFISGQGGVGKTFLIRKFIEDHQKELMQKKLAITASTGCAAILLNGSTLHSWASAGLAKDPVDKLAEKISKSFFKKRNWLRTKTLIIDEISMIDPEYFEKLDQIGKIIRKDQRPFGGIQLILSGDFCQLPAVNVEQFIFESPIWKTVIDQTFYFQKNLRQNDPVFQKCLDEIRIGECSDETFAILQSRLNQEIDLEKFHGIEPTELYAKNAIVDKVNNAYLKKMIEQGNECKEYEWTSVVTADPQYKGAKLADVMVKTAKENFESNVPCINKLRITVGCQVILLKNLDVKNKLVNGSRGIVTALGAVPTVRFLDGQEVPINKEVWEQQIDDKIFSITQIPLKISKAMSIHKSQGMTIDLVKTDLGKSIFEWGQAYVVLSRVRTLEGLFLSDLERSSIKANPRVVEYYKNLETTVVDEKRKKQQNFMKNFVRS